MTPPKQSDRTARRKTRRGNPTKTAPSAGQPRTDTGVDGRPDDHNRSQRADSDGFAPRAVHLRLAEAFERAFQDGRSPTDSVIANYMGGKTTRETICRWRRMHPDIWQWAVSRVQTTCELMKPLVDRRVTHLAIQGSVRHAQLFYQFVAKVGTPTGDEMPWPAGQQPVQINILTPHPQLPNGGRLPPLPTTTPLAATVVDAKRVPRDIPLVPVR